VGLSSHLLRIPWDRVVFFGAVITVMAFSLNGLASGLGVLYPNPKEGNPSKIVSGFGGTLCLMLSFLYILASVMLLAVGCWETKGEPPPQRQSLNCIVAFIVLSFALGWLPFSDAYFFTHACAYLESTDLAFCKHLTIYDTSAAALNSACHSTHNETCYRSYSSIHKCFVPVE